MSAANSGKKPDIRVVIDTNVFIPAIVGIEAEALFYNAAIRTCWKVVLSEYITNEYSRVIREFGYPADVVIHEVNKLYSMNKYRESEASPEIVGDDLAPRKDRHIVAPCIEGLANLIVTKDGGILEKKARILSETGAQVMTLAEAQASLDAS